MEDESAPEVQESTMPYMLHVIVGSAVAIFIFPFTGLLAVAEMVGPSNFAGPILLIVLIALLIVTIFSKVEGWRPGIIAGLSFALPIGFICLNGPIESGLNARHVAEMRFAAGFTVVLSVLVLAIRARRRQLSSRKIT